MAEEFYKLVAKTKRIYCMQNGWGEVISSYSEGIRIKFTNSKATWIVMYDGYTGFMSGHHTRTLYFGEPNFDDVLMPKFVPTLQPGDRVVFNHKTTHEFGVGIVEQETEHAVTLKMMAYIDYMGDGILNTDITRLKSEYEFRPR